MPRAAIWIFDCARGPRDWRHCSSRSVELVHEGVAGVEGVLSLGDPVVEDDGLEEGPEGHVDAADAHSPNVEEPADEVDVAEAFNLLYAQ
jgi:hypothetical protein